MRAPAALHQHRLQAPPQKARHRFHEPFIESVPDALFNPPMVAGVTIPTIFPKVGYKDCDGAIARESYDADAAESDNLSVGSRGVDDRCWRRLLDFAVLG